MAANCLTCSALFEVPGDALLMLGKLGELCGAALPPPKHCRRCRLRQRLAFRNERAITKGGRGPAVQPSADRRSLFDSLLALRRTQEILKPQLVCCTNCAQCHRLQECVDCASCFGSSFCRSSHYVSASEHINRSLDIWWSAHLDLCYEISGSYRLFHCFFCLNCHRSEELWFCRSCRNCHHCFGCTDLSAASYCIFNKQLTADEYRHFFRELNLGSRRRFDELRRQVLDVWAEPGEPSPILERAEGCSGDRVCDSRHCRESYFVYECRDCTALLQARACVDTHDVDFSRECTAVYQAVDSAGCRSSAFLESCIDCTESFYLVRCSNVRHCFGCVGLTGAEYCVLNRQCTAAEYPQAVRKAVEEMRRCGEWSEFFPLSHSDFAYSDTEAAAFFPESEPTEQISHAHKQIHVPDHIASIGDELSELPCEVMGEPFAIFPMELRFYQEEQLPLPRRCPEHRYRDRVRIAI